MGPLITQDDHSFASCLCPCFGEEPHRHRVIGVHVTVHPLIKAFPEAHLSAEKAPLRCINSDLGPRTSGSVSRDDTFVSGLLDVT